LPGIFMTKRIYIKYMVSIRCKMVVRAALQELNIPFGHIELGEVEIKEQLSQEKLDSLRGLLFKSGLELMDDKKAMLIEKIKMLIIETIHYSEELPDINFSIFLSEKTGLNYTILSNLFSKTTGTTIEHFIIKHKIERVKELLIYDEISLTEISYLLNYSSLAHLSKQFKKVTGLTPTFFKNLQKHKKRIFREDL